MKRLSAFLLTLPLAVLSALELSAQTRTISGNVTYADDGSPAAGAYVTVVGTTIGALTDIDGNFKIDNVPAKAEYVLAKFMGCKDAKVKIGPSMKIVLENDSEVLNEVVVTGMQQMARRLFTGSAAKVNADDAKIAVS